MIKKSRLLRSRSAVALATCLTVAGPCFLGVDVATGSPSARIPLHCVARVNNARPADYSTVLVTVKTSGNAHVVTTAHYKSTDTVHAATASGSGTALIAYRISRATSGYPVIVSIAVSLGGSHGSCKTSFTPM